MEYTGFFVAKAETVHIIHNDSDKITRKNYFVFDQVVATVTGYPAKLTGIEVISAPTPACSAKK